MKEWEWDAFHVSGFQGNAPSSLPKLKKRGVLLFSNTLSFFFLIIEIQLIYSIMSHFVFFICLFCL